MNISSAGLSKLFCKLNPHKARGPDNSKRIKGTSGTNFNIPFLKITRSRRNTQKLETHKRSASILKWCKT